MSAVHIITAGALALAAIPCGLFLANLLVYRPPRQSRSPGGAPRLSVLIPARNEEATIRAALDSVLASRDVELEVLVLDDHSTDRTAEIVRATAARDGRVRLIAGQPLPAGWCGKQFACHTLAQHAREPLLVFLDADVRLQPDALARMAAFLAARPAVALASGVPRQLTGSTLERLLIPLIHFVLLGFLPMLAMRRSRKEKFAAGCGQLFIARRDAYHAVGGHAAIRASLHDGLKLPRAFRRAGFLTDLFDATPLATCRMYQTNGETWRGLGKNAIEGLAAPGVLPAMTVLLLGGQVLPFLLAAALPWLPAGVHGGVLAAVICAWLPRWIAALQFRQSWLGALAHPLGVLLLLAIQWQARLARRNGTAQIWKGRAYGPAAPAPSAPVNTVQPSPGHLAAWMLAALLFALSLTRPAQAETQPAPPPAARPPATCPAFTLDDQYKHAQTIQFPRAKPLVLVVADHPGSEEIQGWINALKEKFGARIDYAGLADVRTVPRLLRGMIRSKFKDKFTFPVMLDWQGRTVDAFQPVARHANLFLISPAGAIPYQAHGTVEPAACERLNAAIERLLAAPRTP